MHVEECQEFMMELVSPPFFNEKARAHAVGGMWPGALRYSRTTADG